MTDFKDLTTLKSVNKDWKSVLEIIKQCRRNKINVMLQASDHAWLKGVLMRQKISFYTLANLAIDPDSIENVMNKGTMLDSIVICPASALNAMNADFKNKFFHIEVSHLQKSP